MEKKKRMNAKHRARNTKKGHEEIMQRNKESQRIASNRKHAKRNTAKGHEEIMRNNREYQTAGKSSGGYRNKGVGKLLIQAALDSAKDCKLKEVYLACFEDLIFYYKKLKLQIFKNYNLSAFQ